MWLTDYWPPLWWLRYSLGVVSSLAAKSSELAGLSAPQTCRTPLLSLHVSTLSLRKSAPLPKLGAKLWLVQPPTRSGDEG